MPRSATPPPSTPRAAPPTPDSRRRGTRWRGWSAGDPKLRHLRQRRHRGQQHGADAGLDPGRRGATPPMCCWSWRASTPRCSPAAASRRSGSRRYPSTARGSSIATPCDGCLPRSTAAPWSRDARQQRDRRHPAGARGGRDRPCRWARSCTPTPSRRRGRIAGRHRRARRRCPDPVGPQDRRAARGAAPSSGRTRICASPRFSPAAGRSGGCAPAPRTSRPSPVSGPRPTPRFADLGRAAEWAAWRDAARRGGYRRRHGRRYSPPASSGCRRRSVCASPGLSAETLVIALDLAGVAVSSGSACSSGKVAPSHVLAAMGVPADLAKGAIRVSLGWQSAGKDLDLFATAWRSVLSHAAPGEFRAA